MDEQEEEDNNDVLNDDDIRKIHRLQLINASARFELLSANQQLIDFGLSRLMNSSKKVTESKVGGKKHLNDLYNIDKSVIEEASETEENNTTNMKIGRNLGALRTEDSIQEDSVDRKKGLKKPSQIALDDSIHDKNRDSMFGTMLYGGDYSSKINRDNESRMR